MKINQWVGCLLLPLLLLPGCGRSGRLWLDASVPLEGEPAYAYRILDHWDNLDDTVERGYAGRSIWGWTSERLPAERIALYGALNERLGINGVVLNNVNASPQILDGQHLARVDSIAGLLRPYGIRVYLAVNFASPMALGELPTADPLDAEVAAWWRRKADEIYALVPDFGGFLVKASSEGQPGPGDFGRSHAEGANMLAAALEPHGGMVLWRAFVYSAGGPDRACQAYDEFVPLDGAFAPNVSLQVKNGPVDFQPREPFSPLFGALRATSVTSELQITMEYLGQASTLVFLAPLWAECLQADTFRDGSGSTVAGVTSGSPVSAIAGVANVGDDPSWCGNLFNQANWYAFGRLAWDPTLEPAQIAEEWLRITFPRPFWVSKRRFAEQFIGPMKEMMLSSREAFVDYTMPLGLHHLFAWEHHFGPEPWCSVEGAREDWLPRYYHQAAADGIGFDRTRATGSGATGQYHEPLASLYENLDTCPEELLLWFHHVPWDHPMASGRPLWDELCLHYDRGVKTVRGWCTLWAGMRPYVNRQVYRDVAALLEENLAFASWWRDACLQYFAQFSGRDYPPEVERPVVPLDSLQRIHLPMGAHN